MAPPGQKGRPWPVTAPLAGDGAPLARNDALWLVTAPVAGDGVPLARNDAPAQEQRPSRQERRPFWPGKAPPGR